MTEEDEEFNRIEREASMRQAAVRATVTKKEWVGLTDEEINKLVGEFRDAPVTLTFAIEEFLRKKNT